MRALLVIASLALAGVTVSVAANAREPDTYGFGSRSTALGGAVAADANDFSANYYNPAGLVGAPGLELSLGYLRVDNQLQVQDRDTGVDSVHGLVAGLVAPGKILGIPFAFGLATYLPDDGLSRIKALRQEVPRWELYDTRPSILFLAANLAIRPVSWLEIGGGVAFLAATRGRFAISGRADLLSPYDSQLRHEVDADLTSVRYPQLGVRVAVGDLGKLGLVYRGQSKLQLSLEARLQGTLDFAGIDIPLLYLLETRTVAGFSPQQVVLGASFTKVPRLTVNADLGFVNWAAYDSPTARTSATLDAQPPPGTPVRLPGALRPTRALDPGFENRFVPRFGVEYKWPFGRSTRQEDAPDVPLLELPIRAGYFYEASPVPPQTGITNLIDADRHVLSLGTGVALHPPVPELPKVVRLDLHGQLAILPEREIEKTNPADFIGSYRADGTMLGFGATLSGSF